MSYQQCAGVTKTGKPCKGGAMAGSAYCGPHSEGQSGPVTTYQGNDFGVSLMLEVAQLKAENRDLREALEETRQLLQEAYNLNRKLV